MATSKWVRLTLGAALLAASALWAEEPAPRFVMPPPTPNDTLVSPLKGAEGWQFAVYAPQATAVSLEGEMLPLFTRRSMTRREDGVWTVSVPNLAAGTYRYVFNIDGASVADPRNPLTSQTQTSVRSLLHVDGIPMEDVSAVPHGAVAELTYHSPVFSVTRRLHVYTPPGFGRMKGERYPVFYLLHGGGDSDASWSTVGRAGVILDNLLAAGKIRPMIVVMPAGHVPSSDGLPTGALPGMGGDPSADPFVRDMLQAVIPLIEREYPVRTDARGRAIAGLSMGGIQAANLGLTHPELFSQVAIFSSGWFPEQRAVFEQHHGADLERARRQLKLLWIGWGKDDPLVPANADGMVALLRAHGLEPDVHVTEGSHDWPTWRRYLVTVAPLLFR